MILNLQMEKTWIQEGKANVYKASYPRARREALIAVCCFFCHKWLLLQALGQTLECI